MTKIVYTKFSPFDIACYSVDDDVIYIEEKLKGTKIAESAIKHEMKHSKSNKLVDVKLDMGATAPSSELWSTLKIKPLYLLSPFIPLILHKKDGKWTYGLDLLRVMLLFAVLIGTSVFVMVW